MRSNSLSPVRIDGLTEISIGNNNIGDVGAIKLAEVLAWDRWLNGLDLRHNGITESGLGELQ